MFKFRFSLIVVMTLALTVAACSHAPKQVRVRDMKDPQSALVYGQIILPSEDWHMRYVLIQRVGKIYGGGGFAGLGEKLQVTSDGRFVAENLQPGKYMLGGFMIGDQRSMLGKEALNFTVDVKPGGIHYFGSYKYIVVRGANMIRPGEFDLEKASNARNQINLLTWVEEATRDTQWNPKVGRELSRLGHPVPSSPAASKK